MKSSNTVSYRKNDICIFNAPRLDFAPIYPFTVEETERRNKPFSFHTKQLRNYNFSIVSLLISGNIHYHYDSGADFIMKSGDIMLVTPGSQHMFESYSTGGSYHKLVVEFKGFALREMFLHSGITSYKLIRDGFSEFRTRIETLRNMFTPGDDREKLRAIGFGYELLHLLLNYEELGWGMSDLLFRGRTELEKPDFRPVSEIAAALGVSRNWFDREFLHAFGVSPSLYRRRHKLDHAKILLSDTSMSIKEIADRLGYCNQFHFAGEFRRFFGTSPRKNRNR